MMPRFLEVARQTFLLQARGRIYLAMTVLSVFFACIFFVMPPTTDRIRGDELFQLVAYGAAFTALLPFVTLFLAAQAVTGDIEDRTSVYLFTRPISRISLLAGKWLAVILLAGLFITFGLSALFAVIGLGPREWQDHSVPAAASYAAMLGAGWLAVVGYASVGCLFAAFFRRPVLVGVLYILIEQFASRLPPKVGIHTATVAFPVRVFMYQNMDACRELRVTLSLAGGANADQRALLMAIDPIPAIVKTVLFTMILATWIYARREYDSRPRE